MDQKLPSGLWTLLVMSICRLTGPFRYYETLPGMVAVGYPFPELQTFASWMLTLMGIGLANEGIVRALKRMGEGQ